MATQHIPDVAEQKSQIEAKLQKALKKGDVWFIVATQWLKQWKCYVGYESWDHYHVEEESANPGPIDNTPILQDGGTRLKEHLIDDLDYVLIPEDGWNNLVSWYGLAEGQESLLRKVIMEGVYTKALKVEIYPWHLILCENSNQNQQISKLFSRSETIEHLEKVMQVEFNIADGTEVRLWNRYMTNMFEPLNKKNSTLQDAGLYQGQVIVIEQKNDDGTWPSDNRNQSYISWPNPKRNSMTLPSNTSKTPTKVDTYTEAVSTTTTSPVESSTRSVIQPLISEAITINSQATKGEIYASELGSEFDGSIRIHSDTDASSDTSENEDNSIDQFEVVLQFKSRRGGYNTKLMRADQGIQALKWRFAFRNKDHSERLAKALANIPATLDSKVSSNVVIQTEQTVKYALFQNNVKAIIEAEIEDVKVEEMELNAEEANSTLKFINVTCPEFPSQKTAVFLENGSGQIRVWLVGCEGVFDTCVTVFRTTREYLARISELRFGLTRA